MSSVTSLRDGLRMVEREAVGDASAAVVPDDREPLVPELAHERDESAAIARFE